MDAEVAQALGTIFSQFGFLPEIMSDKSSDFMQIFLNDFSIHHVRSSPYHPQSNGACQWFNGTLKTMLQSLLDSFPDSWDMVLPWILFAYREVPVETVGFSPFELMFGRTVSGPLLLIKSACLQHEQLHDNSCRTARELNSSLPWRVPWRLRHCLWQWTGWHDVS